MSEHEKKTMQRGSTGRRRSDKVVPTFSLDRCKHCGICSHFCPVEAISTDLEGTPRLADPEACTACRLCERLCPDFAIEMVPEAGRSDDAEPETDETRAPADAPVASEDAATNRARTG